jgi:hypothetical protein
VAETARFPRCPNCGRRLAGLDLWLRRYALSIPLPERKRCARCKLTEERRSQ